MVRKLIIIGIVLISFLFQDLVASDIFVKSSYAETKPKIIKKTSQPRMKSAPPKTVLDQKKSIEGEVEKKTDSSERWVSILSNRQSILDIQPHPTENDTLYVLIADEENKGSCGSIYKTSDGGMIWNFVSTIESHITDPYYEDCNEEIKVWHIESKLYFDRTNPAIMYYSGPYMLKSLDSGKTWDNLGSRIITASRPYNFAQDQNEPDILYVQAGGTDIFTNPKITFKSNNGGKTWGRLTEEGIFRDGNYYAVNSINGLKWPIEVEINDQFSGKRKLNCRRDQSFAPTTISNEYTAITIYNLQLDPLKVFGRCYSQIIVLFVKSKDSGRDWEVMQLPKKIPLRNRIAPLQGDIHATATNIQKLLFGVGKQQNSIFAVMQFVAAGAFDYSKIFMSEDDGSTWKPIMQGLRDSYYQFPPPLLVTSKSGTLYTTVGNEGLYKSENHGENWYFPANIGLPSTGSYNVTMQKDSGAVYATSKDLATSDNLLYRSLDGGLSWTRYELAMKSPWERLNSLALSLGHVKFNGDRADLMWSLNWGKIIQDYRPSLLGMSPAVPNIVYINVNNTLLKSEDSGFSWTKLNAPFNFQPINDLIVDENSPDFVLVLAGGMLYKTVDGGLNWINISQNLNKTIESAWQPMSDFIKNSVKELPYHKDDYAIFSSEVRGIKYVFLNASNNTILVTTGLGGAYMSVDSGKTWKTIFRGIDRGFAEAVKGYKDIVEEYDRDPSIPFKENDWKRKMIGYLKITGFFATNHIVVNSKNPNIMYVSTEKGAFKSIDGGKNWNALLNGLNNQNFRRIITDPSFKLILAETDRGNFRLSDKEMTWIKGKEID